MIHRPILTPKTVLPLFFAIGIIFAPIGGGLLYASAQVSRLKGIPGGSGEKTINADIWVLQVQELIIDYSTCFTDAPESPASPTSMPSNLVTSHFNHPDTALEQAPEWSRQTVNVSYGPADPTVGSGPVLTTRCTILFSIPADMTPPVLFYYRLTNFYQNHRRYAKSFNTDQLSGTAVSAKDVHNSDCTPLTTVTEGKNQIAYYPCGLAPNSVFNDTFYSPILLDVANSNNKNETYVMQNTSNISWESDKKLYGESKYNWSDVAVPPNWIVRYPNGYSDAYHPDLVNDEQFQVWMRLAGLPTFSKLTQRNDTTTMSKGRYSIDIDHRAYSPFPSQIPKPPINLTPDRLQRNRIRRHKVHHNKYTHRDGWQEPLPRHRVRGCWRPLHSARCALHGHASDQAKEVGRPHVFELEQ